ncbi:proteasome stabiliser-domain-containing protein [Lipomyces kononenkoae]|uniref:Proteasome stabiliser-domain-containing protein n=1 Tax=Lipomyces kononenkoae TaxID=34357 RepID=A0ACC3T2B0_LIPKO
MASTELALVNKVEMRIALANTDEKLEALLKVYLAPLLLKLASPHEDVRNKVVSICNHINTRIKSRSISLPTESLLAQFKTAKVESESILMRNFCLMYIQMAVDRLTPEQQNNILPHVINGISGYERQFQKSLFAIVLKLLPMWNAPERGSKSEDSLRVQFGFDDSEADTQFLSKHFTAVMLLDSSVFSDQVSAICCPGVAPLEFEFITSNSKDSLTPVQLARVKRAILQFVAGAFTDYEKFWPSLAGSQDKISEIYGSAEDLLRKITIDYEREDIVNGLYDLFLGKDGAPPVPAKFRTRIFQLLSKSNLAADYLPQMLLAIDSGIKSAYPRERMAAIEFVHWTAKVASTDVLATIAHSIVRSLLSWIKGAGWPIARTSNVQERTLRGFAYETIGSLAKRVPDIISHNLQIIEFLFSSLKDEHPDMKSSVHGSLSSLIPVLSNLDEDTLQKLREFCLKQMNLGPEYPNCQYLALRYCISALPFSDPTARYICILGLDPANRADIVAEAKKGLHPYWFRKIHRPEFKFGSEDFPGQEYAFPEFESMINFLIDSWSSKMDSDAAFVESLQPQELVSSLQFLRQILVMKAFENSNKISIIDEGWEFKLNEAVALDHSARTNVVELLAQWWKRDSPLQKLMKLAFDGFTTQRPGMLPAGNIWLELLSLGSIEMVSWWSLLTVIGHPLSESLIFSHNADTRSLAAHALGILASATSVDNVKELAQNLVRTSGEDAAQNLARVHGSIISLGYILSRLSLRGKLSAIPGQLIGEVFQILVKYLEKPSVTAFRDSSIAAISELGAYEVLSACPSDDIAKMGELLLQIVKQTKSERALSAFGNLSLSFPDAESKLNAVNSIYALHESTQIEFLFSGGEALSVVAAGWGSTVLERSLDIQGLQPSSERSTILDEVLDKVLELCKSTKPALKKASCIWLLSLLQFCGHLQPVMDRLKLIHFAFLAFLGDRDDIVQESASRGLSLVYDKGDNNLKDDLVRSLVQSFTSDNRDASTASRISAETQLFDPGVLNTGDGSVSTYKDIMSLAAEAGDPSLIYKFMSLASSSAIWSTRKGAAFGLGSILSKTSLDEIFASNPRLRKNLVPKLYRYRYDPNTAVQQSMKDIWNALISDSAEIIDSQFDDILEELLKRIGDREWRVRQASCAALQDLLDGSQLQRYESSLERIWQMSFRALDDIKESVRNQAVALCRSLANSFVRNVDTGTGVSAQRATVMLQSLLPFLLGNAGLQSQAAEVQAFSLDTLLKLVQQSGVALRPFIPTLLEELLGLLSTLEPQAINYIALNADKYGLTGNAIDATRLVSIRNSPMMDAIDKCIDLLDSSTMKELVPKLQSAIRKGVGLPSKVAASRVLVTMVVRHIDLIQPYADRFLKAVTPQLSDRNDTVATSYAAAAGYLCRVASNEKVLELVETAQKMYFESEDERSRVISGSIVSAISKNASDKFTALASSILPFVYIAKYDPEKGIQSTFANVWTDNTGGVGAIKLYFPEILRLASVQLESQQWRVRQTVALSLAEASNAVGNQISATSELFIVLMKASSGRSWQGKEKVIEALANLSVKMKGYVQREVELNEKLLKLFLAESKRNNAEYKVHAKKTLEKFCHEFDLPVPSEN